MATPSETGHSKWLIGMSSLFIEKKELLTILERASTTLKPTIGITIPICVTTGPQIGSCHLEVHAPSHLAVNGDAESNVPRNRSAIWTGRSGRMVARAQDPASTFTKCSEVAVDP
jgi:hypothetical protein